MGHIVAAALAEEFDLRNNMNNWLFTIPCQLLLMSLEMDFFLGGLAALCSMARELEQSLHCFGTFTINQKMWNLSRKIFLFKSWFVSTKNLVNRLRNDPSGQ